jgi:hypothetical protein
MAGSEAQAGFYYQNIIAAQYTLELVEFGSRLRSITLENPRRAKYIDDIIIDHNAGATFVQVKWSQDEASAFTLHNLVAAEEDSTSLLAKLARGYEQIANEPGQKEIILLSTRRAGSNRQPGLGFDKSLTEFINEFHKPFVNASEITDIRMASRFEEYEPLLERLLTESGLKDINALSLFLKSLRFRLNQPDRDTMIERVRARLVQLGIDQSSYGTLLDEVVKWSITRAELKPDHVLHVLGVYDHFVDRVSHYFPVDRKFWVHTPDLFERLDSSIGSLDNGFILLEGEPGSGKSTALTIYLSERPGIRFGYYCFVPNDRTLGNERLGDDAFVRSICIGLRNAFPDVEFPKPYAPQTVQLLSEWLQALSAANQRVVFVVDGLDHVDRKTRQSLVARPLTAVLDADLPSNVLIVLSSRYQEALPPRLIDHVKSDARRHIQVPRFGQGQCREFFGLRGVALANELLEKAVIVSGGVPIYLEYLADRLGEMNRYDQEHYLESVPTLRDERIDVYHRHLWDTCSRNTLLVYILAILSIRDEFTTPETLRELLPLVGINSSLHDVHQGVSQLHHVLRVSDANSVAIRHSSLAEFVAEQTAHLRGEITRAIVNWYDRNPDSDEAWRHRLRHLFHAGEPEKILESTDDNWLTRAWANHRPTQEIQRNLSIAWRAASTKRDILEFIRIGLLKQQIAIVSQNLNLSDVDVARLLLYMGRPDEALRMIWDGERRQCSAIEFASFFLAHLQVTGRTLPEYIFNAGLGDGPGTGANVDSTKIWYRARALVGDPVEPLMKIGRIHWINKGPQGLIKGHVDEAASEAMNHEIQLAVIRELAAQSNFDALRLVQSSSDLPHAVRAAAKAAAGFILVGAGEDTAAATELHGLDLSCLPGDDQRWYFLKIASRRADALLASITFTTPPLPSNLLNASEQKLRDDLFNLYDSLRCFFLRDETGFPWFEAAITSLVGPAKTLVSAIGRLAWAWTRWLRKEPACTSPLSLFKAIAKDLDLQRSLFHALGHRADYTEHLYRQDAFRFYEDVWTCAAQVLSETELEELATWWANSADGVALRYPEATRTLAKTIHTLLTEKGTAVSFELLKVAEQGERADEEAASIAPGLMACAQAWGQCGFSDEAQRLWCELLDVACGVYWRKDYQFNEILKPLALAHEQDPSRTLDRVEEQLTLAHQLVGTARSKTVGVAIEGLIEFISRIDPGLALEALVREEDLIYRERALDRIIRALLDEGIVDRRLLLAVAGTMGRWQNYTEFDEYTKPAVFALYASAIDKKDLGIARQTYDFWRHVLVVEKQMPAELGRWAALWVKAGSAPEDVQRDLCDHPLLNEESASKPAGQPGDETIEALVKALEGVADDIGKFETLLDQGVIDVLKRERSKDFQRFQRDFLIALGYAASRDWTEEEAQEIGNCYAEFVELIVEADFGPRKALNEAAKSALTWFVETVSERLSCNVTINDFGNFFDINEWLNQLIRIEGMPYFLEQKIEHRLPRWISAAPFEQLDAWEDFCRRRCHRQGKVAGLLALAERRSTVDRGRAIANLIDAWQCISDTFYEYRDSSHRICEKLIELDSAKGSEIVFESFRQQYEQFPGTIIYRLDSLIDFAAKFSRFDGVHLYDIWSAYNRRLAAGLSQKPADLAWLKGGTALPFQAAFLKYMIRLFNYPVVDVRLLAFDELFRLTAERADLVQALLKCWPDLDYGQKEYAVILFFSAGLRNPESAEQWAPQIIELGRRESHRNLRTTIADAVEIAMEHGATLDPAFLADARALKARPCLVTAKGALIYEKKQRVADYPPYLQWCLKLLAKGASPGELDARTRKALLELYPHPEKGLDKEMAVHRAYNINTNFDGIEISGEYDQAVRAALNRGVQMLVQSYEIDHDILERTEDVLRLRDPSDVMVKRVIRPNCLAWLNEALSDDEFVGFVDVGELKAGYAARDGEWVTLFEYTEQRTGERFGSDPQRATIVQVMVFGIPRGDRSPSTDEINREVRHGTFAPQRNRYRFELVRVTPPSAIGRISPIVSITNRAFRGRRTPTLAAVVPAIVQAFGLRQNPNDLLGYLNEDGENVVQSIEWQEAFDQGRRRHEPRSAGYFIQMKRGMLKCLAERIDVEFWAHISTRRTKDRYKPEKEMLWHEHSGVFPLRLTL